MDVHDASNGDATRSRASSGRTSIPPADKRPASVVSDAEASASGPSAIKKRRQTIADDVLTLYFSKQLGAPQPTQSSDAETACSTSTVSTVSNSVCDDINLLLIGGDEKQEEDDVITLTPVASTSDQFVDPFLEDQPGTSSAIKSPGFTTALAMRNVDHFAQTANIWTSDGSIEWSMEDNKRMNELCHNAVLILGNCDPLHRVNESHFTEVDMTIVLDVTSRQMIEMCKNIGEFRRLDDCMQMKLIKENITTMCALRGNLNYDPIMQAFRPTHLADGWLVKFDQIKHLDFYKIWKWFYPSFESTLVQDRPLILLLMAVSLFHQPSVDDGDEQSVVVLQNRNHYNRMLQAYLVARLGSYSRAMNIYNTLMNNKLKLRQLQFDTANFLNQQASRERIIDPLLMELYDVNHDGTPSPAPPDR